MKKRVMIITDLDNSLVNSNLERDFVLYNILHPQSIDLFFIIGVLLHSFGKNLFKLFNINFPFKLFYVSHDKEKFLTSINHWLKSRNQSSYQINKEIINHFEESSVNIVLTACPYFIAKSFLKVHLGTNNFFVIGTDLREFFDRMIFVRKKMIGFNKKDFVNNIILNSDYKIKGFGNKGHDSAFLNLCDEFTYVKT